MMNKKLEDMKVDGEDLSKVEQVIQIIDYYKLDKEVMVDYQKETLKFYI